MVLTPVDPQDRPDAGTGQAAPHEHARLAVGAFDAERQRTVALLQRSFADGRLTQAELEERARAAYAARSTARLRDLTADLPAAQDKPRQPGMVLNRRLLCILLCFCPPAGVAYWLLSLRQTVLLRSQLSNARPRHQLLTGAIVASAGAALQITFGYGRFAVLAHLAGAVLVSAGVIVALPAISRPLHRTWVIVQRAFPVRGSHRPLTEQPGPDPED